METAADLNHEIAVAHFLQTNYKVFTHKLCPKKYSIDFAFYRQMNLLGFGEVKARRNASTKFQTYIIDVGKIAKAKTFIDLTETEFTLWVLFEDCLASWTMTPATKINKIEIKYQQSFQRGTTI